MADDRSAASERIALRRARGSDAEAIAQLSRQAIERGLSRKSDWPLSGFRLDDLYRDPDKKWAHRKRLLEHLEEHPFDADAHFLLGVVSHFDGAADRAAEAFGRTIQLNGGADHAWAFLPREPDQ